MVTSLLRKRLANQGNRQEKPSEGEASPLFIWVSIKEHKNAESDENLQHPGVSTAMRDCCQWHPLRRKLAAPMRPMEFPFD
jgi:hypothetical protein